MKVKVNEKLFLEWNELRFEILDLSSIIQNNHDLSDHELEKWKVCFREIKNKLETLYEATLSYVQGTN